MGKKVITAHAGHLSPPHSRWASGWLRHANLKILGGFKGVVWNRLSLAGGVVQSAHDRQRNPPTVRCLLYNGRIISIVNIQIIPASRQRQPAQVATHKYGCGAPVLPRDHYRWPVFLKHEKSIIIFSVPIWLGPPSRGHDQ